jgi:hypothetical protein
MRTCAKLLALLIVGLFLLQVLVWRSLFGEQNKYDPAPFQEFHVRNKRLYDVPNSFDAVSLGAERFEQSIRSSISIKRPLPKLCVGISSTPSRKVGYLYRTLVSLLQSGRSSIQPHSFELRITVFNTAPLGIPNPLSSSLSAINASWFEVVNVATEMRALVKEQLLTPSSFQRTYCHSVAYRFMLEHLTRVHSQQQCDALVVVEDDVAFSRNFGQRVLESVAVLQKHDHDWLWLKLFAPTSAYISRFGWDPLNLDDQTVLLASVLLIAMLVVLVGSAVRVVLAIARRRLSTLKRSAASSHEMATIAIPLVFVVCTVTAVIVAGSAAEGCSSLSLLASFSLSLLRVPALLLDHDQPSLVAQLQAFASKVSRLQDSPSQSV